MFEQPVSHFYEILESIDGRKNRENTNHRNSPNGIANPDSKAARQERRGAWVTPYKEDIFKVNSASVLQHWSPPRPLSINVGGARVQIDFLRADKHLQK